VIEQAKPSREGQPTGGSAYRSFSSWLVSPMVGLGAATWLGSNRPGQLLVESVTLPASGKHARLATLCRRQPWLLFLGRVKSSGRGC
jgi:hypothetical protein